jgi:hypothetical protein
MKEFHRNAKCIAKKNFATGFLILPKITNFDFKRNNFCLITNVIR